MTRLLPLLVPILLVLGLSVVLFNVESEQAIKALFAWIRGLGSWGFVAFVLIDMLVVVLLLPGIVLTMGAGFLFGLVKGTLLIILATTAGGATAFLIARYLFNEAVTRYLGHHPKLNAISDEFTPDAWKIVMLTRLIPFFPFKLSNYFFGITNFSLWHYVLGTLIGIIPNTIFLVYLGSITADIAAQAASEELFSSSHWLSYVIGLAATVVALTVITQRSRRALARYQVDTNDSQPALAAKEE